MIGYKFPVTVNRFPLTGNKLPVTGNKFLVTGDKFAMTGNKFPLTENKFPLTGNKFTVTRMIFLVIENRFLMNFWSSFRCIPFSWQMWGIYNQNFLWDLKVSLVPGSQVSSDYPTLLVTNVVTNLWIIFLPANYY